MKLPPCHLENLKSGTPPISQASTPEKKKKENIFSMVDAQNYQFTICQQGINLKSSDCLSKMAASTIRKVIPINTCQHNVVYSAKDVIYQIICSITIVFNAFRTDRDDDTPNSRLPWLSSEAPGHPVGEDCCWFSRRRIDTPGYRCRRGA